MTNKQNSKQFRITVTQVNKPRVNRAEVEKLIDQLTAIQSNPLLKRVKYSEFFLGDCAEVLVQLAKL